MSALTGVVATSARPADELRTTLHDRGWHVAVLDGATSKADALEKLGRVLAFPAYYGRNLDALADCLGDLDGPTALLWRGWEPLAVHTPGDWAGLVSVLTARANASEGAPFSVVFLATPAR